MRQAPKKDGPQALGRSRGGFGTKIHGIIDALGNAIGFTLTGSEQSDIGQAIELMDKANEAQAVLADKGYDSDALVEHIEAHDAQAIIFAINFTETENDGSCAATGITSCPDIFVIKDTGLNEAFTYGGVDYFLSVFALGPDREFNVLNDAACIEAGVDPGCQGFTTEESQSNAMHFGVAITTQEATFRVPAPGVLRIMGLGLLLIAIFVRRRRNLPIA